MEYPILSNAKAINLAAPTPLSPYYDVVWSFDYAISGNANTEAGFSVFLTRGDTPLNGGSGGIDLGYSGLSSTNTELVRRGVIGGLLCVGFDTTGLFAASASIGGQVIRDGISEQNVKRNSITIRSGSPTYSYNTYTYHEAISSIDTAFNIVESGEIYKTIRARLGNVGQTIYIDYRNSPEEEYKPLLTKNLTLPLDPSQLVCPGISFVTSISSSNANSVGTIFLKNFTTSGNANDSLSSFNAPRLSCIGNYCFTLNTSALTYEDLNPQIPDIIDRDPFVEPKVDEYETDIIEYTNTTQFNSYLTEGGCFSINTATSATCVDIVSGFDMFNFGYQIELVDTGVILTRTSQFRYEDASTGYIMTLSAYNDMWRLTDPSSFMYSNSSVLPIGTYIGSMGSYTAKYYNYTA